MALASNDGSVRVRNLATATVLTEPLACQRFHEGGGTVKLSAVEWLDRWREFRRIGEGGGNRIEQAPPCLLRD
jgi:hypothetical protein